jgi:hypothetical protein
MPNTDDTSFIEKLSHLLGIDPDEATSKVGAMDVDNAIELVSAVSAGDAQRARALLSTASEDTSDDDTDEAEDGDEARQVTDTDNSLDIDSPHNFAYGDAVVVNGEKGVVKIPRNGKGKVGVLINGKMRLCDPSEVKPENDTISEDVDRVLTLAGLKSR